MRVVADATPILALWAILPRRQHIPPDMKFDPNANPPCFSNPDDNISIERNARVRLKLLGLRVDATEIFAIGGSPPDCKLLYLEDAR